MSEATIRPSTEADVPTILSLIRELAEFEERIHEVTSTAESLRAALFGERPCAEAIVAEVGEETVAYAIFFTTYSSFLGQPGLHLEDVYVKPEHRGNNIGTSILKELAKISAERNYGRMEWTVLNWNQRAIDFYQKHGAEILTDWRIVRTDSVGIDSLADPIQ